MGLFHGIFGTPQTAQQSGTSGTKRSSFFSGKDTVTLTKGEIVKGEVTDLRSNEVTIRLEDGKTLHAKLSTAMELSIGQKAEFFVQETNDVLITLKLLSGGDTSFAESAIDKALEASGFPKPANAVNIVRSLLEAGLPASKEMIQKMMQHSAANKEVELSTLAALLKHNLPVTKENASQLQAYRNFEHRLLGQAATLTSSLTEAFQYGEASPAFTGGLLTHFFGETTGSAEPSVSSGQTTFRSDSSAVPADGVASTENASVSQTVSTASAPTEAPSSPLQTSEVAAQGSSLLQAMTPDAQPLSLLPEADTPLKGFLSEAEYNTLGNVVDSLPSNFPDKESLKQDLTNGTLSANRLFSAFSTAVKGDAGTEVTALFKEEPLLSSLLGKTLLNRFVLTPEDLSKEHAVEEFYARTAKDLAALTELTSSAGDSSALNTASATGAKMQDNLQFMNTLNQIFPYIQLPLKLTEQLTHGELYVYTKKKDLSAQNKEVSILLHLDMDALGPTDIHLTLLQKNVTAKFYLNESEAQTLVTKQLPSLTEALQKKGYALNASVTKRTKDPDIVTDFLDGGEAVPMKRFRFDIRA